VLGLEVVALIYIVTWWSGYVRVETYVGGQLDSFSALMLLVGLSSL